MDQVIVVTGASAGIGAALARQAGAAGARVVLAARRLPEQGTVLAYYGDIDAAPRSSPFAKPR